MAQHRIDICRNLLHTCIVDSWNVVIWLVCTLLPVTVPFPVTLVRVKVAVRILYQNKTQKINTSQLCMQTILFQDVSYPEGQSSNSFPPERPYRPQLYPLHALFQFHLPEQTGLQKKARQV